MLDWQRISCYGLEFTRTTTSTTLESGNVSLAHSVDCWTLNLEAPGSILAWDELSCELFISTFLLFPIQTKKNMIKQDVFVTHKCPQ